MNKPFSQIVDALAGQRLFIYNETEHTCYADIEDVDGIYTLIGLNNASNLEILASAEAENICLHDTDALVFDIEDVTGAKVELHVQIRTTPNIKF